MTPMTRRRVAALAAGACATAALIGGAPAQAAPKDFTWEVTITNVTSGQPFSPPYVATSSSKRVMYKVGKPASSAIQEVAENGDTAGTMLNYLVQAKASDHVYDWAGGVPPATKPLAPAGTPGASGTAVNSAGNPAGPCSALNFACPSTQSITVHARSRNAKLSVSSMLVCTNDGFVGLAGAKMPKKVGQTLQYTSAGHDAGTELNTQNFEDLMPWCQTIIGVLDQDPLPLTSNPFGPLSGQVTTNPLLAEGGVVTGHDGIESGVGELSAIHGWAGPAATIDVTRTG